MRIPTAVVLALVPLFFAGPAEAKGSHYVRSYTTRTGTHVQGHRQTDPDHSRSNNWSTRGNINPYTGKAGTKSPWRR